MSLETPMVAAYKAGQWAADDRLAAGSNPLSSSTIGLAMRSPGGDREPDVASNSTGVGPSERSARIEHLDRRCGLGCGVHCHAPGWPEGPVRTNSTIACGVIPANPIRSRLRPADR
jgi:hypothetical protein